MYKFSTHKTLLATALTMALAPGHAQPIDIALQAQLDMPPVQQVTIDLFTSESAATPLASETFFPGMAAAAYPGETQLQVDFQELDTTDQPPRLWAEAVIDGQARERQVVMFAAVTPGVTFAAGNNLDMDGNYITGLADPDASQDAATKAYVDAQVGSVPGGDITAVIAGTGLNGGSASGDATLGLQVPLVISQASSNPIIDVTNTGSGFGLKAAGNSGGGHFEDLDSSGYARVGYGDVGIRAKGNEMGGYFEDLDNSGHAQVGYGDVGIQAYGNWAGGYFKDMNDSGYANVGSGDVGIQAYSNTRGGYFADLDSSGYANVGVGDYGIWAKGNEMGGYFGDLDDSGYAYVGAADYGIQALGNFAGGHFADLDSSGYANVGNADYGIQAYGNTAGGYFKDRDSSGYANVGVGDYGIKAYGNTMGGYFKDRDSSGYAYVGYGDYGIQAYGNTMGGRFEDLNSSTYARIGYGTSSTTGNGTKNFVQNHPENADQVIVYTAPEGDEVATYTRGSAKLINGEARIPLGETFKWVTNPDLGLTAHLTLKDGWSIIYRASLTTSELVVRSAPGYPDDVAFDYIIYGLRIGFEDVTVVQKKTEEARIPSMADHRKAITEQPELARYTALSRYARMQGGSREAVKAGMNSAAALLKKIEVFDPAVHKIDTDRPDMKK